MHRPRRFGICLTAIALVAAPAGLGSCGAGECSMSAPHDQSSFVGRITSLADPIAAYRVESVHLASASSAGAEVDTAHAPGVGAAISVYYISEGVRFLRVGDRYRVVVNWDTENARYASDVHTAEDCGNASGTVHADGTAIDTGRVSWVTLSRGLVALALLSVVLLAVIGAWLWYLRRRTATVRVDDRYL